MRFFNVRYSGATADSTLIQKFQEDLNLAFNFRYVFCTSPFLKAFKLSNVVKRHDLTTLFRGRIGLFVHFCAPYLTGRVAILHFPWPFWEGSLSGRL